MGKDVVPSDKKRIVIVDDHPLLRRGLQRLIDSTSQFVVCGEAGNAAEGQDVVRQEKPDLVIVDIGLPTVDGIELTKQLIGEFEDLRVLIFSMHEEADYAVRAIRAGALGYMVKYEAIEKIERALEDVFAGRLYLSPGLQEARTELANGAESS